MTISSKEITSLENTPPSSGGSSSHALDFFRATLLHSLEHTISQMTKEAHKTAEENKELLEKSTS